MGMKKRPTSGGYLDSARVFRRDIRQNFDLAIAEDEFRKQPQPQYIGANWGPALIGFYRQLDGFHLDWYPIDLRSTPWVCGRTRILSAEGVARDPGVYFEDAEDERLKSFRIVDYFVDEACVGFYDLPGEGVELYLSHFESFTTPLNVDLDGYLRLLYMARGYWYWQKALPIIESGKRVRDTEYEDFKKHMPQIFPDFSWEQFEALYFEVRLRK